MRHKNKLVNKSKTVMPAFSRLASFETWLDVSSGFPLKDCGNDGLFQYLSKVFIFLIVIILITIKTSSAMALEISSADISDRMAIAAQNAEKNSLLGRLTTRLSNSLKTYENTRDYRALFTKRERLSSGKLGEKESIFLYFDKPFRVFMKWLNTQKKGLQVCYARGQHGNKLGIHKPGLFLGLAPVVFLDQNSLWVKEGSESYNIEDAGIGTFLTDFSNAVLKSSQEGKLDIQFSPGGEQHASVIFKDSKKDSIYFAYKVNVFFDARTQLPTRMELYDWQLKLMGIYSYGYLQINNGNQDKNFTNEIHRQLYKAYF